MLCKSISSSELLEVETDEAEVIDVSSAGGEVVELVSTEYDAEDVSAVSVPIVRRSLGCST